MPLAGEAPGESRLPRALLLVAVLFALLPIVTATARALDDDWFPVGDNSVVYVRTTDVFTEDTPLLYLWSTGSTWADDDFNNPGPERSRRRGDSPLSDAGGLGLEDRADDYTVAVFRVRWSRPPA